MIQEQTETINNASKKMKADEAVIEINNLKKSFGQQEVLKDVSLKLLNGENLVILGKSGSGKSVLIQCVVRLINFDAGTINVLGNDVSTLNSNDLGELRKKIGFLFQSGALYDSMTVRENLEFPLKRQLISISKKERNVLIEEALENVGLSETIDMSTSELSGGMRKRLGLARTLILKPEIMLYDEPTTGLDPITSKEISNLILEVQKKYETSSIIITHDIECTKLTANRIIVINDGVCAAEGSYNDLKNSDDKWIKSFFE